MNKSLPLSDISFHNSSQTARVMQSVSTFFIKVSNYSYTASAIFLPWYLWALSYYPQLYLWWLAFSISVFLCSTAIRWPRSVFYWLPPCVLCFNTIHNWLWWPSIKMVYIAPAAICFSVVINRLIHFKKREHDPKVLNWDFAILFSALIMASAIAVIYTFMPSQKSAWNELKLQLHLIPLISEFGQYISLRYIWLWFFALATYKIITMILKNEKNLLTLLWSIQWSSLPVSLFGIYSYMTRTYMVSHYVYERRINATLSSPAVLADIFTAIAVLGMYLFIKSKSVLSRCFLFILILLQLVSILYSGCRINILFLILACTIWLLIIFIKLLRSVSIRSRIIMFLSIILVLSGSFYSWRFVPSTTKKVLYSVPGFHRINQLKQIKHVKNPFGTIFKGRVDHWKCARNAIKKFPLWGLGCGRFEQRYIEFRSKTDLFRYARVHNYYLRIFAEGGAVSFIALWIFIIMNISRFLKAFKSKNSVYKGLFTVLTVSIIAIAFCSLTSDVFYETSEAIIFLAILSGCAAFAYSKCIESNRLSPKNAATLVEKINEKIHFFCLRVGWGYLGNININSFIKIFCLIIFIILVIIGGVQAQHQRRKNLYRGKLEYGFGKAPIKKSALRWFSIGKSAMIGLIVKKPVMFFHYRALNDKMVRQNVNLQVFIAHHFVGSVNLDSTDGKIAYFDVSDLVGKPVTLELKVNDTYVPLDEHWFADPKAYGAIITKPMWNNNHGSNIINKTDGKWFTYWSSYPTVYDK